MRVNNMIELRQEVSDILKEPEYLLFLPQHMISIDPNSMDPPDLRAWLFETYTLCDDYEACENLNTKIRASHNFVQLTLRDDSIELRALIFTQRERWSEEARRYR